MLSLAPDEDAVTSSGPELVRLVAGTEVMRQSTGNRRRLQRLVNARHISLRRSSGRRETLGIAMAD